VSAVAPEPGRATIRTAAPGAVDVLAWGGQHEHPAVRWAAAAAQRRGVPLEVLVTADAPAGPVEHRSVFARTLSRLREAVPGLALTARAESGRTTDVLRARSTAAGLLVVPADLPDLAEVVAGSFCPVAVVPETAVAPDGPVVVGVAAWTAEETVELAFTEADARHAWLVAVRTWDDPVLDLGWLRPDRSPSGTGPSWSRAVSSSGRCPPSGSCTPT
jgi:hypothetical protein